MTNYQIFKHIQINSISREKKLILKAKNQMLITKMTCLKICNNKYKVII